MLFNRFYQPDLDVETLEVVPSLALLSHGPDHLSRAAQVAGWLDRHGYESPDQIRGKLSQRSVRDPAAFERANYLKVLASHRARPTDGRSCPAGPRSWPASG